MILIINTIERDKIELGLSDKTVEIFKYETKNQSDDLLIKIEKLLKSQKKSFQDLTAIVVNQGPGSFTGVRVGVAVANTLAWSLNIPVFGFKDGNLEQEILKLKKLKLSKFSNIVLPHYPAKK